MLKIHGGPVDTMQLCEDYRQCCNDTEGHHYKPSSTRSQLSIELNRMLKLGLVRRAGQYWRESDGHLIRLWSAV
jgi:hypothetical protein